jgi:hypothetical protein
MEKDMILHVFSKLTFFYIWQWILLCNILMDSSSSTKISENKFQHKKVTCSYVLACSKTTLTGESRLHISTLLGIEPGAVRDQVGLSHCWQDGQVTVRDKARLRWGHNDQSLRGHQCSETMLTGESRFHISSPMGIEPRPLMTGSKRVDHCQIEDKVHSSLQDTTILPCL